MKAFLSYLKGKPKFVWWMALPMVLGPIADYYLMESFCINVFKETRWRAQILNIVFFELILLALFFAIGNLSVALSTETVFFAAVGILNYAVIQFRSTPLVPWDIFSFDTAVSVAGNYHLTFSSRQVLTLGGFIVLYLLQLPANWAPFYGKRKGWLIRLIGCGSFVALFFGLGKMTQTDRWVSKWNLYPFLFTPKVMAERNGFFVTYVMDHQYLFVEKPEGYSAEEAKRLLEESAEDAVSGGETDHRPDIVVVMDEAFSDLSVLGELDTNEDYMPYLHSLMNGEEDTVTGIAHVSVKGGNTPNSEFEFLTGNTEAFLPAGSIPFQQYIKKEIPDALPNELKALGYETTAIHPFRAEGWSRNTVYPLLGFDRFLSQDDFKSPVLVRNYISDESSFEKVLEVLDEGDQDAPKFVFNVTMQNHGSYGDSYTNFPETIHALSADSVELDRYLSLIKITDDALRDLVEALKNRERDTILVFFGDHQPNDAIASPVLSSNGKDVNNLDKEDTDLRYVVPFLIWANFDIDEDAGEETSLNYLAGEMLSLAGMPLSTYRQFLEGQEETFPVISAECVKDENGTAFEAGELKEPLDNYRTVQYYELFDAPQN